MNFQRFMKLKEPSISEFIEIRTKSTPVAKVAPELKQHADAIGEITKTCAVLGCEDYKNLNSAYFFRFPEDAHYRQIWTDLTGRHSWTPTDFSYICIQHFSMDSFNDDEEKFVLNDDAVPSQKLPNHVFEVEYIDDETLENEEEKVYEEKYNEDKDYDYDEKEFQETDIGKELETKKENVKNEKSYVMDMVIDTDITVPDTFTNGDCFNNTNISDTEETIGNCSKNLKFEKENGDKLSKADTLQLFTEIQRLQRTTVSLKEKLKHNMNVHNRNNQRLKKLQDLIEIKRKVMNEKRKKKSKILLTIQDKLKNDQKGLVLAMPMKQTDDLKNFSLSIYKYSPQAYIYIRNTLRTMLPSTDVLDSWITAGHQPKNVLLNNNMIKVVAEQTDKELSCKVTLG